MYIKFLPHSTGGGADAIDYLLGARDHKGAVRAGVEVLRGDPYLSGQLIDSLDTVHRYSSAVIAWEQLVSSDPDLIVICPCGFSTTLPCP